MASAGAIRDEYLPMVASSGKYGVSLGGQKTLKCNILRVLRCPFFAPGPRFHKNHDILEVVHYNVKLLYQPPHISILVHLPSPWLSIDMQKEERQSLKEMQSSRKCKKEDRARKRCNRAGWTGIVRCLVYWWTRHWAWFEKRREEPQKGSHMWWEDEPLMFWKF